MKVGQALILLLLLLLAGTLVSAMGGARGRRLPLDANFHWEYEIPPSGFKIIPIPEWRRPSHSFFYRFFYGRGGGIPWHGIPRIPYTRSRPSSFQNSQRSSSLPCQ